MREMIIANTFKIIPTMFLMIVAMGIMLFKRLRNEKEYRAWKTQKINLIFWEKTWERSCDELNELLFADNKALDQSNKLLKKKNSLLKKELKKVNFITVIILILWLITAYFSSVKNKIFGV